MNTFLHFRHGISAFLCFVGVWASICGERVDPSFLDVFLPVGLIFMAVGLVGDLAGDLVMAGVFLRPGDLVGYLAGDLAGCFLVSGVFAWVLLEMLGDSFFFFLLGGGDGDAFPSS